jgi:hypothetical protein
MTDASLKGKLVFLLIRWVQGRRLRFIVIQDSGSSVMEKQCEWILFWMIVLIVKSRLYIGLWTERRRSVTALPLCIHNIPGSILSSETGYPGEIFVDVLRFVKMVRCTV